MGYYCKIVHEDSSDYMVATAPVGNIVERHKSMSQSSRKWKPEQER